MRADHFSPTDNDEAERPNGRLRLLLRLYARLDRRLAKLGLACAGCGECCHFDTAGHILYASPLEREAFAAAPPPSAPDAGPDLLARGLRCPFQQDNRCHAREARVLGCRLHFCQADDPLRLELLSERWHRRLKRLHDLLGIEWDYRPLLPRDELRDLR